jgi:hypothetical protein
MRRLMLAGCVAAALGCSTTTEVKAPPAQPSTTVVTPPAQPSTTVVTPPAPPAKVIVVPTN